MDQGGRMETVRRLCAFDGRLAGTDAERRAANWLAERLRGLGRRADVEPTYVHPQRALAVATHCLLALAGSLLALELPPVGFALVLASAASLYLDLNGRLYLLRRLFFRRASQNVVSRGDRPGAPARLILCARYDVRRSGAAYGPRWRRLRATVARLVPAPFSSSRLLFWAIALLLPALGLRMAGVEASWLSALQLPPTLILVVACFLLVDIELSRPVPGANTNASGVAAALTLAEELERDPTENLDVWIVLPGGGESSSEGMRAFLRGHRDELETGETWFVSLESLGGGEVRFTTSQGPVVSFGMASRLTQLCAAVADAGAEDEDRYRAGPLESGSGSDALPAPIAGYPATTITCLPEHAIEPGRRGQTSDSPDAVDPAAMERAHRFTAELVRALDRDLARKSERAAAPV